MKKMYVRSLFPLKNDGHLKLSQRTKTASPHHRLQMVKMVVLASLIVLLLVNGVAGCTFGDSDLQSWAKERLKSLGNEPCAVLSGGVGNSDRGSEPKVKVFLFQKDEDEVLSDWLQYYSYLFGAQNLVVIDHHSQNQGVCRLLELYNLCGTEVQTHNGHFSSKHVALTREMKRHNDTFLLPLDVDEFVVPVSSSKDLAVHRTRLLNAFRNLPIDGRKYKFAFSYSARPTPATCLLASNTTKSNHSDLGWTRRVDLNQIATYKEVYFPRSKTFYHSDGFIATDQGNHYGQVKHDRGVYNDAPAIQKNLKHYFAPLESVILHYSVSSYRSIELKYLRGFSAYNFTLETNCSTVKGGHSYCNHGKKFLTDRKKSEEFYGLLCASDADYVSLKGVSDWFAQYTLTFPQIVA